MRHKLTRQFCRYQINMEFVEGEVGTQSMEELFDIAVGDEVPLAWGHQHFEGPVLEVEEDDGRQHYHGKDAKQHLAEHFEVSSEGHGVGIFFRLASLHDECVSMRKGSEIIRQSNVVGFFGLCYFAIFSCCFFWCLFRRSLFVQRFVHALLETINAFAQAFHQFRHFLPAKDEQGHARDEQQFRCANE